MIGEKMELNEDTLQILKNFASINSNIVFDEGNTIKTISEAKNILSEVVRAVRFNFPHISCVMKMRGKMITISVPLLYV